MSKKPSNWGSDGKSEDATMHSVQQFENVALGANDMKKKLVVRKCFLETRKLAIDWMEAELKGGMPTGVFVITGTPGIGKSVFLAYFAAYLCEKGYNVVIQRGQKWWSHASGKATTHEKNLRPCSSNKRLCCCSTRMILMRPSCRLAIRACLSFSRLPERSATRLHLNSSPITAHGASCLYGPLQS